MQASNNISDFRKLAQISEEGLQVIKTQVLASDLSKMPWLCHLIAVQHQLAFLISCGFRFFICEGEDE